ncbi:acyl-CoA thioesterase [Tetzosporium hominis]|nr:thioesterase family protein [Tetzosporium hominis]
MKSNKSIEVRYAETDQMGVVYHANYLVWLEMGRTQLIKDLGFDYAGLESKGYLSPVLDVSIQYKQSARYGDTVSVSTWIDSYSRLKTIYGYEVTKEDGTVLATAKTVHTLVAKETFRPIALSKVDQEWHEAYEKACVQA